MIFETMSQSKAKSYYMNQGSQFQSVPMYRALLGMVRRAIPAVSPKKAEKPPKIRGGNGPKIPGHTC